MRTGSSRQTSQASVPLRKGASPEANEPLLDLHVRKVRWTDAFAISSIRQRYLLNQPNTHWRGSAPTQLSLRRLLPFPSSSARCFVACADRRLVGYAIFDVIGADQRWVLEGIGANLGIYEAEPVLDELLRVAVISAGLEGTKRLYARVPDGSGILSAVRRSGFTPYAAESILGSTLVPIAHARPGIRRQSPSDLWSIHQLYMATVPKQVQYAEALTSHHWDLRARSSGAGRSSGWLVEDGYQAVAYMRAESSPEGHVLECLVHPDHRDVFGDLLATTCADLGVTAARRILVVVRGYQRELLPYLTSMGFVLRLEQDVHVKYTTAPARISVSSALSVGVEVKEPAGKRVPTFLHGQPSDPSSEGAGS
ncbi:MAG TPA: hypothetical protein VGR08_10935 [Thermomicrobiales bacterium]|nr:hypothetical protein [Thermomicrobiales bacterium]